jgi:hypothetical protein
LLQTPIIDSILVGQHFEINGLKLIEQILIIKLNEWAFYRQLALGRALFRKYIYGTCLA